MTTPELCKMHSNHPLLAQLRHFRAGLELAPNPCTCTPAAVVDVFAQLVREVDAGRALLATPEDKRRAAADALALARDVLEDARHLLEPDPPTCVYGADGLERARAAFARGMDRTAGLDR